MPRYGASRALFALLAASVVCDAQPPAAGDALHTAAAQPIPPAQSAAQSWANVQAALSSLSPEQISQMIALLAKGAAQGTVPAVPPASSGTLEAVHGDMAAHPATLPATTPGSAGAHVPGTKPTTLGIAQRDASALAMGIAVNPSAQPAAAQSPTAEITTAQLAAGRAVSLKPIRAPTSTPLPVREPAPTPSPLPAASPERAPTPSPLPAASPEPAPTPSPLPAASPEPAPTPTPPDLWEDEKRIDAADDAPARSGGAAKLAPRTAWQKGGAAKTQKPRTWEVEADASDEDNVPTAPLYPRREGGAKRGGQAKRSDADTAAGADGSARPTFLEHLASRDADGGDGLVLGDGNGGDGGGRSSSATFGGREPARTGRRGSSHRHGSRPRGPDDGEDGLAGNGDNGGRGGRLADGVSRSRASDDDGWRGSSRAKGAPRSVGPARSRAFGDDDAHSSEPDGKRDAADGGDGGDEGASNEGEAGGSWMHSQLPSVSSAGVRKPARRPFDATGASTGAWEPRSKSASGAPRGMQPGLFDEAGRSGARPDLAPSAWADGAARQQQSAGVFNAPSESLAVPAPAPASPTAPRKGAIDGGNVGVLASLWHLEEEGERSIVEMLGALPEGVSARMALWLFLGTIVLALCLCGCCCCLALKLASGGFSGGGNLGPGGMEDSDDEDARLKPGADGGSDVVVEADLLGISTQLSPPQPASQVVAPSRKAAAATRSTLPAAKLGAPTIGPLPALPSPCNATANSPAAATIGPLPALPSPFGATANSPAAAGATAAVGVCSAAASALAFSLDMPGAVPFDDDKDDPEAELWGLSAGREDDDDDWAAFDEHGK